MKPRQLSASGQLLFTATRLTTLAANDEELQQGTGLFWQAAAQDGRDTTLVVTNKHVLDGAHKIALTCIVMMADPTTRTAIPSGLAVKITVTLNDQNSVRHPDPGVDLAAFDIGPAMDDAAAKGRPYLAITMSRKHVPTDWSQFDAIEDVLMVGCPIGLFDTVNTSPIVRRGITGTPLGQCYMGKQEFMVDLACFPGSSGSPIYLFNPLGFLDTETNTFNLGQMRFFLLGILYGGPLSAARGVVLSKAEVAVLNTAHLGFAIRSTEILVLEELWWQRHPKATLPKPS